MIVAGSMIGSGIFIVSADIARQTGSAGWTLGTWIVTGLLTMIAAYSFGQLAAAMPKTGGQYAYLRELYSPLIGFLYGWAFFLVIQTGTIAAVAVGFARFLGVMVPWVSPTEWIVAPIHLSDSYALSLSTQQLVGIMMLLALTALNSRGLKLGRWIQNVFTSTKTIALALLILIGIFVGWNADAVSRNFGDMFRVEGAVQVNSGMSWAPSVLAGTSLFALIIALGVAQVGSLFSADAWNGITFTAGEVKDPRKTIPRALALGTGMVIALYILANIAYLVALPLSEIQSAPDDRVATLLLQKVFGPVGATLMAVAIVISTFGCNNGLVLAGARVTYAMSKDGLFFSSAGKLNAAKVPGPALWMQALWACLLVLPRTVSRDATGVAKYGNLYSDLLDYVVFAVLIFYVLTIFGLFRLKKVSPEGAANAARAFGHPWLPLLYIVLACAILTVLMIYKTDTSWPGLVIVLTGIPVYFLWRRPASTSGAVDS